MPGYCSEVCGIRSFPSEFTLLRRLQLEGYHKARETILHAVINILVCTFVVNGKYGQHFSKYFVHICHLQMGRRISLMSYSPAALAAHILSVSSLLAAHDHIKHDCSDDDRALDDGLQIGADADHVHAVVDKSDDEDTKHAARDRSDAACE